MNILILRIKMNESITGITKLLEGIGHVVSELVSLVRNKDLEHAELVGLVLKIDFFCKTCGTPNKLMSAYEDDELHTILFMSELVGTYGFLNSLFDKDKKKLNFITTNLELAVQKIEKKWKALVRTYSNIKINRGSLQSENENVNNFPVINWIEMGNNLLEFNAKDYTYPSRSNFSRFE